MRLGSLVSACAVSALAMVFSVQQGEHGPLVVYKLEVPRSARLTAPAAPVTPVAPPAAASREAAPAPSLETLMQTAAPVPAKARKLSPLKPTILGTVVMPAQRRSPAPATPAQPLPLPLPLTQVPASEEPPGPVELDPYAFSHLFRGTQEVEIEVLVNAHTGELLTLEEVSDAVVWRRDTAEKLRQLPIGPRF